MDMLLARSPTSNRVFWAGFIFVGIVGFYNIGIIALDDYSNGISVMIPAQSQPPFEALAQGVHPPLPKLILQKLARIPLALGILDPILQLRLVLAFLGIFSFCVQAFSIRGFYADESQRAVALSLLGFYFACPLFLTRPMIESLSMSFLTLSCYFACRYWRGPKTKLLIYALLWLSVASMMRIQVGVCFPALLCLAYFRRHKDILWLLLSAAALFCLTGAIDHALRGGFHESLRSYLQYNLEYASSYGRTPFYVFPILFLLCSIPPTFFSRFRGFSWRTEYSPLLPLVLYFLFFLVAHSVTPHKEERFMVPILPIFLCLLVPLMVFLWRSGTRWRLYYFGGFNLALLLLTSFNIPQRNVIGLAQFLESHPEYHALIAIKDTFPFFPGAYVSRPIAVTRVDENEIGKSLSCSTLFIHPANSGMNLETWGARPVGEFSPGPLEALIVKLNPGKNARRGTLVAYLPTACP